VAENGIPHSAFRIPHSAFRIPHSAFRIPHSAFRIPHSAGEAVGTSGGDAVGPRGILRRCLRIPLTISREVPRKLEGVERLHSAHGP
jgi:hypothetical protein